MNGLLPQLAPLLALSASSPFWRGEPTGLAVEPPDGVLGLPPLGPAAALPRLRGLLGGRRPARADRAASPTTRTSGGTSGRTRGWGRSRSASATRSPGSRTRSRSPRTARRSSSSSASATRPARRSRSYHRILTSENKWLAARYGLEAPVMDLATGEPEPLPIAQLVRRTLRDIEPHARELGSERELEGIAALLDRGNSRRAPAAHLQREPRHRRGRRGDRGRDRAGDAARARRLSGLLPDRERSVRRSGRARRRPSCEASQRRGFVRHGRPAAVPNELTGCGRAAISPQTTPDLGLARLAGRTRCEPGVERALLSDWTARTSGSESRRAPACRGRRSAFLIEGDTVGSWMLGATAGRRRVIAALVASPSALRRLRVGDVARAHVDGRYLARPARVTARRPPATISSSAGRSGSSATSSSAAPSPFADPYSFRPEAEAPPNLQGWLFGLPYWPLAAAVGNVWAYNLVVLLSFVLAGAITVLVAARARARRGRPRSSAGSSSACALPGRPVDGPPARAHLVPPAGDAARARAAPVRRRPPSALAAIPLSGQLHLALGAIPLALGYAWARTPRADWWKAGIGAAAALGAGLVVDRWAVAGSIGTGRSFAQVDRYSAELSDFVTRGVGSGHRGARVRRLADAARGARGARRRPAAPRPRRAARAGGAHPLPARARRQPPGLRDRSGGTCRGSTRRASPSGSCRSRASRSPRSSPSRWTRAGRRSCRVDTGSSYRSPSRASSCCSRSTCGCRCSAPSRQTRRAPPTRRSAGRGGCSSCPSSGRTSTIGSVYLAYARQSPRERPQGYSTIAPKRAVGLARELRPLSCGRGTVPADLGVRFVAVHRGLYAQSGFFAAGCAERAEAMLRASGWHLLAGDGAIATYAR